MQNLKQPIIEEQYIKAQSSQQKHHQLQTKQKKSKNSQKKEPEKNYHWSKIEQQRYVNFLSNNIEIFKLPYEERVKLKVQVAISKVVQKRNPQQCRSHHQKMLKKHGSIENILKKYKYLIQVPNQILKEKVEDYPQKETKIVSEEVKMEAQFEGNNHSSASLYFNTTSQVKEEAVLKQQEEVLYKHFI